MSLGTPVSGDYDKDPPPSTTHSRLAQLAIPFPLIRSVTNVSHILIIQNLSMHRLFSLIGKITSGFCALIVLSIICVKTKSTQYLC